MQARKSNLIINQPYSNTIVDDIDGSNRQNFPGGEDDEIEENEDSDANIDETLNVGEDNAAITLDENDLEIDDTDEDEEDELE